jgi:hypothetical protein
MKFINKKINKILIVLLLLNISAKIFSKTFRNDINNHRKQGTGIFKDINYKNK